MAPKLPGEGSFQLNTPSERRSRPTVPVTPVNLPSGSNVFAIGGSYADRMNLVGRGGVQQAAGPGQLVFDSTSQGMPQRTRTVSTPSTLHPPTPLAGPSFEYPLTADRGRSDYWDESTFYDSSFAAPDHHADEPVQHVEDTSAPWAPPKYSVEEAKKRASAVEYLRKLTVAKVTLTQLIIYVIEGDGDFSSYRNTLISSSRTDHLKTVLSMLYSDEKTSATVKEWMFPHALDLVCNSVHKEMDAAKPAVKMYAKDVTPEFIESWDISDTMEAIQTPVWSRILDAASETKASKNKVRAAKSRRNREMGRAMVTAQVFYLRSQVSQRIQIGIGLMAWSTGASKQMIDVLHQCALSIPYSTIREVIKQLSNGALRMASLASKGPHSLAYDNINFSTSIFVEQGPQTPNKVQSGTFSLIYELYGANPDDMKISTLYANLLSAGPLEMDALRPSNQALISFMNQSIVTVAKILFQAPCRPKCV